MPALRRSRPASSLEGGSHCPLHTGKRGENAPEAPDDEAPAAWGQTGGGVEVEMEYETVEAQE